MIDIVKGSDDEKPLIGGWRHWRHSTTALLWLAFGASRTPSMGVTGWYRGGTDEQLTTEAFAKRYPQAR